MNNADACETCALRINTDMTAAAARIIARDSIDNDEITPVGYDGYGAALYSHQVTR